MIVGSLFRGDEDTDVMWLQHDVYGEALGIITSICQEYTHLAHRILDYWDGWEFIPSFDHRTLQYAHDVIAATWRFRGLPQIRQIALLIDRKVVEEPNFQRHWLNWLDVEVRSWMHDPYLIRFVVKILRNQNNPTGYQAEDDLKLILAQRYDDVPWSRPSLTVAHDGSAY